MADEGHTRRKFYDVHVAIKAPLAAEALQRIAALYAVGADIRGQPADERRAVRQQRSRPLVEAMHTWLNEQLRRISGRSGLAHRSLNLMREAALVPGAAALANFNAGLR